MMTETRMLDFNKIARDWTLMPEELLDAILEKVISIWDYFQFSAVCKTWFFVAINQKRRRIEMCMLQPPLLLIPRKDDCCQQFRSLYSIIEQKIYRNSRLHVPYGHRRLCGSSYGWLIAAEEDLSITLIHPFSNNIIHLPPIKNYSEEERFLFTLDVYVLKVILSANPLLHPDDYMAVAVFSDCYLLATFKSNDQSWIHASRKVGPCTDVLFYRGDLYVTECYNSLHRICYNNGDDDMSNISNGSFDSDLNADDSGYDGRLYLDKVVGRYFKCSHMTYIVESTKGDLLLVRRFVLNEETTHRTNKFEVYKMMIPPKKENLTIGKATEAEWMEIHNLGDDALFLGDSHSISVLATQYHNCRANCIYYTNCACMSFTVNFYWDDMGIFDLSSQKIEPHYVLDPVERDMSIPIWIAPIPR